MSKHTPGPWLVEGRPPNIRVFFSRSEPGNRKSPCFMADDDQEANARLIAAAPEMYVALLDAREYLPSGSPALRRLDAAIAKAEGRQ